MTSPMFDLPEHALIPVDKYGDGPCDESDTVKLVCWCAKREACDFEAPGPPRSLWARIIDRVTATYLDVTSRFYKST